MKKQFEASTHSTSSATVAPTAHTEKVPVNSVTIDAVNFIMENVFDWESQKAHAGLRITYEDCKILVKSLKSNLVATCPDVGDHDVTDLFGELLHNNWAGEFQDIKDLTQKVVTAYLEAEMGNLEPITTAKRQMKGKIAFMETHYSDVSHKDDVPAHILVESMDRNEKANNAGGNLESRKALVMTVIQNKRGEGRDALFDGEQDPELLKIVTAVMDATTEDQFVEALESFEDYLMHAELKAMNNVAPEPVIAAESGNQAVAEKVESSSIATRLKQKLPGLTRFFMG